MKTGLRPRRSSKGSSSGVLRENNLRRNHKDDAVTSLNASLRSLKSKLPIEDDPLWKNSIETVTKELLQKRKTAKKCSLVNALCRKGFKGLTVVMFLLLLIGVFLYLYKPASFFLKRKLHSRLYPTSRLVRKNLLVLHPYLHRLGINLFGSCILKNPFISSDSCHSAKDVKEWFSEGQTVPSYILEAARNGKWWIIRSALNISEEFTLQHLHQFSVENNGQLPTICEQIVGGGEDSQATAFYTDLFNVWRMEEALKSTVPWSLSWLECPDDANSLSVRSLFPSPSYLPQHVTASSKALISLSTEWCITFHYQNGLPSTLLNLIVMKGEIRIIPVILEKEHCQEMHRLWHKPFLLKEGDAVILDHQHWSYEVTTWSNYSISLTLSIIPSEHTNEN